MDPLIAGPFKVPFNSFVPLSRHERICFIALSKQSGRKGNLIVLWPGCESDAHLPVQDEELGVT